MLERKVTFIVAIAYFLQTSLSLQYFGGHVNYGTSIGGDNFPGVHNWAEKYRIFNIQNSANYKDSCDNSQDEDSSEVRNKTVYATMERGNCDDVAASNESPEFKSIADILNSKRADNTYPSQRAEEPQIGRAEIIVHRPAPIIVKRPPTKVIIRHPPLVVKPSPVIFQRPPPKVLRPVIKNVHPQRVKVEPILVKVKKPLKKVYIKTSSYENQQFMTK